jgi:hypothetical protein
MRLYLEGKIDTTWTKIVFQKFATLDVVNRTQLPHPRWRDERHSE